MFLVGCDYKELPNKTVQGKPDLKTIETATDEKSSNKTKVIRFETGIIPTLLHIPEINLEAKVSGVGLNEDGEMEVPKDVMKVGWYTNNVKPGQKGNVVLVGHVDSYLGPGIFFDLKNLEVHDEIIISDGSITITYKVVKIEKYPYENGPLQEIFGFTAEKRLHLITCTGAYNPFKGTHEERLVVTAIAE